MKGDFAVRHQQVLNSVLAVATDHATSTGAFKAPSREHAVFALTLGNDGQHFMFSEPEVLEHLGNKGEGIILGVFTASASVCQLSSEVLKGQDVEGRSGRDVVVDTLLGCSRKLSDPKDSVAEGEQAFAVVIKAGDNRSMSEQGLVCFTPKTFGDINRKVVCLRAAPVGAVSFAIECLRVFDEQDAHRHDLHGLGGLAHLLGGQIHRGGIIVNIGDLIREAREENLMPPEGGEEGSVRFTGLFGRGQRNRGERS